MKIICITILSFLLFSTANAVDFYDMGTVHNIDIQFEDPNWDVILDQLYAAGEEDRLTASITIDGVQFDSVGVRYKGNSSYSANQTKNPLNIKLDHVIDDQTWNGYGTLKLSNCYKDPSFVRETLSYEIARQYMPASKANYADVTINGTHMGLYTNVQSVDKYFMGEHLGWTDGVRIKGELLQGIQQPIVVWDYLGTDSTSYIPYFELKSDEGWNELINFLNIFNNSPDILETVFNVDYHLWMLAYDILMVNLDSPVNYAHNYYLYEDSDNRLNPILWDLNENFGVFTNLFSNQGLNLITMQQLDPLLNLNNPNYPIISQVLSDNTYQRMYIAHMRTMIEENFSNNVYYTRALEIQQIIDQYVQNDQNKFYTYQNFLDNTTTAVFGGTGGPGPGSQAICGITELMDIRVQWLLQQSLFSNGNIPQYSVVFPSSGEANPGDIVTINAQITDADNVFLGYRSYGTQKFTKVDMFDDGQHEDGSADDGVFGASLTAGYRDMEYYIYAENSDQGAFYPARAEHDFLTLPVTSRTGDLVINEINYNSSDTFDCDDWVELYNPADSSLDASGWEFRDEDDSHQFFLPADTIIPADGYIVLVNDVSLFTTCFPNVTNYIGDIGFGFSGGGEALRLYDANGTLVDSVSYDDEDPWPTEPDGDGPTLELIDPLSDNSDASNWQTSTGHGTPGAVNNFVGIEKDTIIKPAATLQAYPNPFNPATNIAFSLPEDTKVELIVYNIIGQKVKTLANDQMTAGSHTITWNGNNDTGKSVASGVYFTLLKTEKTTITKKLVLLK